MRLLPLAKLALTLGVCLLGLVVSEAQPATRTPTQIASGAASTCGVERWAVKTLSDPAARLVNFHPRGTTVSALRRLPPTGFSVRGPGVERTTYRLRARLVEMKLEDDEDYHLVIADLRRPSQTMIVEFPAADCVRHSIHRQQMIKARGALARACGLPSSSSFTSLRGTATITGVGFFDIPHGQSGVAPNAIELHPVLAFTHARCSPA